MIILNALLRKKFGKSQSRNLRIRNKIPAIVYGKYNKKNLGIELEHDIILNYLKKINLYQNSISLIIDQKKYFVMVKEIHWHVFKTKILHIDFIFVD